MDPLFEVHMLNETGKERAQLIAQAFDELLGKVRAFCPEGRELSLVKTKLEEAAFFAKKGMAKSPANHD